MQYRSKPVTAIRRTEDNLTEIKALFAGLNNVMVYVDDASLIVEGINGSSMLSVGDWIIRVGQSAMSMLNSEFEENFEPVAPEAPVES